MCNYNSICKSANEESIIKKFTLDNTDVELEIPADAQLISAAIVQGKPTLFMLVNPKAALVSRRFHIAGAQKPLPKEEMYFIGTLALLGDGLFGHIFEYKSEQVQQQSKITVAK